MVYLPEWHLGHFFFSFYLTDNRSVHCRDFPANGSSPSRVIENACFNAHCAIEHCCAFLATPHCILEVPILADKVSFNTPQMPRAGGNGPQ